MKRMNSKRLLPNTGSSHGGKPCVGGMSTPKVCRRKRPLHLILHTGRCTGPLHEIRLSQVATTEESSVQVGYTPTWFRLGRGMLSLAVCRPFSDTLPQRWWAITWWPAVLPSPRHKSVAQVARNGKCPWLEGCLSTSSVLLGSTLSLGCFNDARTSGVSKFCSPSNLSWFSKMHSNAPRARKQN